METQLSTGRGGSIDKDPFLVVCLRRERFWMSGAIILVQGSRTKVCRLRDVAYEMGFSNP